MKEVFEEGDYIVLIGNSSEHGLSGRFRLIHNLKDATQQYEK